MSQTELQQACEAAGITITSLHLYLDWSEDPKFPRDRWSCTLEYQGKKETFDYFTGIGHRVPAFGVKQEGLRKWVRTSTGDVAFGDKQAIEKGWLILKTVKGKVVGPSVADVVSSLLIDFDACKSTFDDWCSNLGMDKDSLKALNTYIACQRNGSRLAKLLGYTLTEQLVGKEH